MLRVMLALAQRQQHRRHHAARARRRCCHNAAHAGVRLRHGDSLHDDLVHEFTADALSAARVQAHLEPVAADQTTHAALRAGIGVRRILNGLPGRQHLRHRGLTAHLALLHIILQNDLPERDILPRRALKDFLHRIQRHLHRPPYRNRSRSGCPAAPREIPPAGA